ncbi:General amino acid permease AGP1 [Candida viswanathii]|uniref:General amino acid permease AGP1 n=1 Tax=Candida viswanathii TaxID=5486 RepID=A0A367YM09_9ASCO|nr:General amino acid permease AGP1 [Candida viswanathii]
MSAEKIPVANKFEGVNLDELYSAASISSSSSSSSSPKGVFHNFVDSFKRASGKSSSESKVQSISKTELRIMSLSTGLGTGLLVASGSKLRQAGPLGMLIAFFCTGIIMLTPTVNSVSELAIAYPGLPGGFQSYYAKFVDESLGFAIGWNYGVQWMCVLALELVTAAMTIEFWTTSVNPDVFVAIFFVVVTLINLGGAKVYAICESVFNCCKIIFLVGFVIFGIIIDVGGGPNGFIGGRYYHHPGPFTSFKGLASVFVTSLFALGGSEFIALAASETSSPRSSIRSASKMVYYKVIVLFLGSLALVGLLVGSDNPRLMGSGGEGSHASPYVLAAELNGVRVLPHIINAVILISVTSVATAAMYSSPRLIQSMAEQGLGPKWLDYIDKKGRPTRAWFISILAGAFGFIAAYDKQETVFTWLLSISGISFIICWLFICVSHVRFRAALKHRGIALDTLAYVSPTGVWGSYLSIIINSLILVAQFWVSLWPLDGDGKPNANSFFENYLGAPVFLVCYLGHKIWTKNWKLGKRVEDIDVDTGRVVYDPEILALEKLEEKERFKRAPIWKKILIICFE